MGILGVDFGLKRVGIAFAENSGTVAFAGPALTGTPEELLRQVVEEARTRQATVVVVGLPRNMDGTEGDSAARARAFAHTLREAVAGEIVLWDERLTSVQADRAMLGADLSRKQRRKRVDSVAAQLLLQSYLDARGESPS